MNQMIRTLTAAIILSTSLFAADYTGTWVGVVNLPVNPNAKGPAQAPLPFIVHLKQEGSTVTGKMDGIGGAPDVEIVNGKVNGETITFEGVRKINNADVKFNYTASGSGQALEFKIVRADGSGAPLSSSTTRLTTVN